MISADCHAGPPTGEYREYLESRYQGRFDEVLGGLKEMRAAAKRRHIGGRLFSEDWEREHSSERAVAEGGKTGLWDPGRRVAELESDGVVAEVIFPDGQNDNAYPFHPTTGEKDPELQLAGARAHNRWLAELCAAHPERRAGVAVVPVTDIETAVADTRWAKDAGLRGIVIPSIPPDLPHYNHPRYEPIWSICEELGMPVHSHGGPTPEYGELPGAMAVYVTEVSWWTRRVFWHMLWSGVFERHPRLKFVCTEQGSGWIPDVLLHMDSVYEGPMFTQLRRELSVKPSDYWARQCWVGASFMKPFEAERRHAIGVDRIMWGSDYPHMEGTWPFTAQKLHATFREMPSEEIRPMVGENAARVYGFDRALLDPLAEKVGPRVGEL